MLHGFVNNWLTPAVGDCMFAVFVFAGAVVVVTEGKGLAHGLVNHWVMPTVGTFVVASEGGVVVEGSAVVHG